MKVSDKFEQLYGVYYTSGSVAQKRTITARQTSEHIQKLLPNVPYGKLIDIGAGEGAVLTALDDISFSKELHAVEISQSGVNAIKSRAIPSLVSIQQFDGYIINSPDKYYDIGTAIHVLEHVEHERAFIHEITRVCDIIYIEVPLELTVRVGKAVVSSGKYGHINFYNVVTFRNLLETCDLEIIAFEVFSNSMAYEKFVSGKLSGTIKHMIRKSSLWIAPSIATFFMTYLAGAVCRRKFN